MCAGTLTHGFNDLLTLLVKLHLIHVVPMQHCNSNSKKICRFFPFFRKTNAEEGKKHPLEMPKIFDLVAWKIAKRRSESKGKGKESPRKWSLIFNSHFKFCLENQHAHLLNVSVLGCRCCRWWCWQLNVDWKTNILKLQLENFKEEHRQQTAQQKRFANNAF